MISVFYPAILRLFGFKKWAALIQNEPFTIIRYILFTRRCYIARHYLKYIKAYSEYYDTLNNPVLTSYLPPIY